MGAHRVHPEIKIFAMGAPWAVQNYYFKLIFIDWGKNVDMKSTFLAAHGRPRQWVAEINRFSRVHPDINKNLCGKSVQMKRAQICKNKPISRLSKGRNISALCCEMQDHFSIKKPIY